MQLIIHLKSQNKLSLPVDYGYRLSAAIYHLASSDAEYSRFLHDEGYGEQEHFKLFVFSPLKGKYIIKDKQIIFDGDMSFEIRSISKRFCDAVKTSLLKNGSIRLMDTELDIVMTEVYDNAPAVSSVDIRTASPIIVSSTDNKHTTFVSPEDDAWLEMINLTLYRKFTSAYGQEPPSIVRLSLLKPPKKVVSRIKGNWVTAYHGSFHLEAAPIVTAFLFETGLGSKNSQGFGMFNITGGDHNDL